MRTIRFLLTALIIAALPLPALAQVFVGVSIGAPPPIPVYAQPVVPVPNEIWQPGYWAAGQDGYYWVPGTWVVAPEAGYLWTPGYWGWNGNGYGWNSGYWATTVGYYGGVNYGAGYYGNGYDGGRWDGRTFRYNTYVTNVTTRYVHNVYADRNVYVNRSATRISYNGGHGGLTARPTLMQRALAHGHHLPMTSMQQQHATYAAHDRAMFATVNHGRPAQAAVARPYAASNPPVHVTAAEHAAPRYVAPHETAHAMTTEQHRTSAAPATYHATAPEHHAAPVEYHAAAAPAYHSAPAERAAPAAAYHAPPAEYHAAPPAAYHAAPPAAYHAAPPAAYHAAPQQAAPVQHSAPTSYHAAQASQGGGGGHGEEHGRQ